MKNQNTFNSMPTYGQIEIGDNIIKANSKSEAQQIYSDRLNSRYTIESLKTWTKRKVALKFFIREIIE